MHSACLGGKSDIVVTEQLFLKFILNFWGEFCNVTCATPETGVRKRRFHLAFSALVAAWTFGFTWFGHCYAESQLALGQPRKRWLSLASLENEDNNIAVSIAFPTARVVAHLCLRSAAWGFIS